MTEELQAGIDFMRRNIDRNPPVGVSVAFMRALLDERDALQAKLDAVPVEAIRMLRMDAVPDYWIEYAEISDGPASELLNSLDAWLETQVTP